MACPRPSDKGAHKARPYTPSKLVDLPVDREFMQRPLVYHLMGRLSASPTYVISDEDGIAWLWDMETGKLCAEPALQHANYAAAGLAPAGDQMILFDAVGQAYRLPIGRGARETLALPSTFSNVQTAIFVHDAPHRVLRLLGRQAEAIEVTSGQPAPGGFSYPTTLNTGVAVNRTQAAATMSEDQKTIVARGNGNLAVWRAWKRGEDGSVVREAVLEDLVGANPRLAIHPSGEFAALVGTNPSFEGGIGIWSLQTGKRIGLIQRTEGINRNRDDPPRFSPDGKLISFQTMDGAIRVCDFPGGGERFAIRESDQTEIARWMFSPDGKRIITTDTFGAVTFWDGSDGRRISSNQRHRVAAWCQTFSPDGRFHLTVSADGTMQIWDIATGLPVGALMDNVDQVSGAAFSPDGKRIVAGTFGGNVRVWDVATCQPLTEPMRHEGATVEVSRVAISPDGRFFLTWGGLNSLHRVWSMPPDGGGAPTPEWLLRLATACASKRLTEDGELVAASDAVATFDALRREIVALPADAPFVEWGRWFLADRATRSIAPGFTITPAEARKLAEELATPEAIVAMEVRARLLRDQKNYSGVETIEREMLEWARTNDGEGTSGVANQQANLASTLIRLEKFAEAEAMARAALAIREKLNVANTFPVVNATSLIAVALAGQKRYGEAEPLLVAACEQLLRLDAANPPLTANQRTIMQTRLNALAEFYDATGRPEKAAEWRAKTEPAAPASARPATRPSVATPKR